MAEEKHEALTILECGKCKHQWVETTLLPMRVEAFLARAKGWQCCPNCANKRKGTIFLLFGERYFAAAQKLLGSRQKYPFEMADASEGVGDHDA